MENKRNLPQWLVKTLEYDQKMTKVAFDAFDNKFGYQKWRSHMKALEISCHGLIWLVVCVAFLYFGSDPVLWMNMLVYQILDIILIAVIKAFVRRRRPALCADDMFFTKGPDKFSFPSGHASRGFGVAFFFVWLFPVGQILAVPIMAWAVATAISRICLARHHILDVVGGFFLAIGETLIMAMIWMNREQAIKWAALIADAEDPWSSG